MISLLLSTMMMLAEPTAATAANPFPSSAPASRPAVLQGVKDAAYPWVPDQRDGTYRNPVIHADYSDPDVVRDGDDFYLTASSFTNTPGLPILHSRDLVNWTIINHAITRVPGDAANPNKYDAVQPGCGVWAPAIRKHAGKFYIFFPTPDEGIYVTTADDPAGKWSEPYLLLAGKGLIDPCPLWDDDGKAYLIHAYANSRAGIKHKLRVRPMSPDAKEILGDGQIVFDGEKNHPTLEGPKFHKKDGYYYISAPAGGVPTGWQVIFRSRNVYGPYEDKIVLSQQDTPINGPHQGALVDAPDGHWWFLHFQDLEQFGRIAHLQPVTWKDGWPVPGDDSKGDGNARPVLRAPLPVKGSAVAVPATTDEFDAPRLGLQWQWQANPQDGWYSLADRPGYLRLTAAPGPEDFNLIPHLLGQKFPARSFTVTTKLELGGTGDAEAGLALVGRSSSALVLERRGGSYQLALYRPKAEPIIQKVDSATAELVVTVDASANYTFGYRNAAGAVVPIGPTELSVIGHWVGTRVGVFARSAAAGSWADVDYFRFSPPEAIK